MSHASVSCIRKKNFSDTQQCTIKTLSIWTSGVFPCSKTNATTIRSIIMDIMTSKFGELHQAQSDQYTDSVALSLDECITTSKGMGITFPTVIVWEEAG
jgi:hypothetical protein